MGSQFTMYLSNDASGTVQQDANENKLFVCKKTFFLFSTLTFTLHARQHIQCSYVGLMKKMRAKMEGKEDNRKVRA